MPIMQASQANGVHASQSSQPLASLRTLRGALAGTSSSPSDASAGHSLHAEQPQGYKELQQKASEDYLSNYQGLIQDSQSTLQEVRQKLPNVMWQMTPPVQDVIQQTLLRKHCVQCAQSHDAKNAECSGSGHVTLLAC